MVPHLPFDKGHDIFPIVRKVLCLIKADAIRLSTLGNHQVFVLPLEHHWIREMERFAKDNALIVPLSAILARSKSDLAFPSQGVHDFEEHIPYRVLLNHERISDEVSFNIGDVSGGEHWILDIGRVAKVQWRGAFIYANGPFIGFEALYLTAPHGSVRSNALWADQIPFGQDADSSA